MTDSYHDQQREEAAAGDRLAAFLADAAVRAAIQKLETNALAQFKTAKTDDERRVAQAYSRVTDDFAQALRATVDRGELAKRDIKARSTTR